jgi:pimeloyl-ACP methyl ester carboxylesterase
MHTVTSADGTQIAYDRYGEGPALIMVVGAMGHRKFKKFEQIAHALSEHFTVINYDRRGRGDSGPAGPVSVSHEVQDLAALIDAVGGRASLWGWSSGGALALRAAAADIGVEKRVVYEAPFKTDPDAKHPLDDYGERLAQIVSEGDPMAAAKHFMRNGIGMPAPVVALMSLMPPFRSFARNGLTLPFDHAALGDHNMHGRPLDPREWETVTCPRWWPSAPRRTPCSSMPPTRSSKCCPTPPCARSPARDTTSLPARSCRCWRSSLPAPRRRASDASLRVRVRRRVDSGSAPARAVRPPDAAAPPRAGGASSFWAYRRVS